MGSIGSASTYFLCFHDRRIHNPAPPIFLDDPSRVFGLDIGFAMRLVVQEICPEFRMQVRPHLPEIDELNASGPTRMTMAKRRNAPTALSTCFRGTESGN